MTLAHAADQAPLSAQAFQTIAGLLHREAGIALEPHKQTLVRSRLLRRLRDCNLGSFEAYLRLIDQDAAERERMVAALTTNHTKFFREAHHFDILGEYRDRFVQRIKGGDPVAIWSAACSSGQEPYTIAMSLAGADRHAAAPFLSPGFRILATDIAPHAIAQGRSATYPMELMEDIPSELRRWTTRQGDEFRIAPELVARVQFNHLNFMGDWPIRRRFAAIFCRNVMIYFDEQTKTRLLDRLVDLLEPDGLLCIGHSERLFGKAERMLRPVGQTAFVLRGRA